MLTAILAEMGGVAFRMGESLRDFGERLYEANKLRDALARLDRQIKAEKQTNLVYELGKRKRELGGRLAVVSG